MRSLAVLFFGMFLPVVLFSACSFNYKADEGAGNAVPGMVLTEAGVDRYTNSLLSLSFGARELELYDGEGIWAAEEVRFTQFASDGSGLVDAEGTAGLMLVDDNEQIYSLGGGVWFHMLTDDLFFRAPDLRWSKKTSRLCGPRNEQIEVGKDDGTIIRGTGFFAETLSSTYIFEQMVSGQLVNGTNPVAGAIPPDNAETATDAAETPGGI